MIRSSDLLRDDMESGRREFPLYRPNILEQVKCPEERNLGTATEHVSPPQAYTLPRYYAQNNQHSTTQPLTSASGPHAHTPAWTSWV